MERKRNSFTVIELLIVIAIVGLIIGVILVHLERARATARDAKRVQEMNALQKSLEVYYEIEKKYPHWTGSSSDEGVCVEASEQFKTALVEKNLIKALPRDPKYDPNKCISPYNSDCFCYIYKTEGDQAYKLFARMERDFDQAKKDQGMYEEYYEINSITDREKSSEIVLGASKQGYYGGEGRWIKLSIENIKSLWTYKGYPYHYGYWPMYIDLEIWKVDRDTGEKLEQIIYPLQKGELDYRIIKCQKDGSNTGCIPISIGNQPSGKICEQGILKAYGDYEPTRWRQGNCWGKNWLCIRDNNYQNCDRGNPWVFITGPMIDHAGGRKTRIHIRGYHQLGNPSGWQAAFGKHQVCFKYKHFLTKMESEEKCLEYISEWVDISLAPESDPGGKKVFGSSMSLISENVRTRYDNQPVLNNYLEKRCSIHPWRFAHWWPWRGTKDPGPSVQLLRHRTWDNYWAYLGLGFGISSNQPAGDHLITATIKFPKSCFLRDRDGSNNYSFYHHNCGWYHRIDGKDKTVYCCGRRWSDRDIGKCDKFEVSGQYGGTLTIKNYVNAEIDSFDDIRVYIECPQGEKKAFGNPEDPYTVKVSGAKYFWVNDMDYSKEMEFSEALPDSQYARNTNNFNCNLQLNFCGKAYTYIELFDFPELYGHRYTKPSSICVSGPKCPHADCK